MSKKVVLGAFATKEYPITSVVDLTTNHQIVFVLFKQIKRFNYEIICNKIVFKICAVIHLLNYSNNECK